MFALVSLSSTPLNGFVPESKMYASTPTDQISVCGYAGSSAITSGAEKFIYHKILIKIETLIRRSIKFTSIFQISIDGHIHM